MSKKLFLDDPLFRLRKTKLSPGARPPSLWRPAVSSSPEKTTIHSFPFSRASWYRLLETPSSQIGWMFLDRPGVGLRLVPSPRVVLDRLQQIQNRPGGGVR